jgi:Flp pilus assembly protein TadG
MRTSREHRTIRSFFRDTGGAFAMQFAMMVIPLMGCVGLAIDGGRAFVARFELAQALDAAALAIGSTIDPNQDLDALADRFVKRNFNVAGASTVTLDLKPNGDVVTLSGAVTLDTYFMPIFGQPHITISATSEVRRGGADVEVALVLDTTGSMAGSKLESMKLAAKDLIDTVVADVQTPYYSKLALVTFANTVYAGSYAEAVRGSVPAGKDISNATWRNGSDKTISAITKASQAVVTTSTSHGLSNGDYIYLSGINGMSGLNGKIYKVSDKTSTTFKMKNSSNNYVSTSSMSSFSTSGTPRVQLCWGSTCEVQVTSNAHGFADNDWVYVRGVTGMTEINNSGNTAWQVTGVTSNTYRLSGSTGPSYGSYTSNANDVAYCTTSGCEYYRFTNNSGSTLVKQISDCVTERIGSEAYEETAPSSAPVGRNYPTGGYAICDTSNALEPLSIDKAALKAKVTDLATSGSTAGQLGLAWAWYLLSPDWAYLWPADKNRPAAYSKEDSVKVLVLMTDGAFNTAHYNGVASKNYSAAGNSDKINQNATNGNPFDQAENFCDGMKGKKIVIYTVGFELGGDTTAKNFLKDCATDTDHAYLAASEEELKQAFQEIATSITLLRLSK